MSLVDDAKVDILLALTEEPSHGYALAKHLDLSSGYIYTHLSELEEAGMIEVHESESEGRQRKFYRITDNGQLLLKALGEDVE